MVNRQQVEQSFAVVCFDSFDYLIKNQRPSELSEHYK